MGEEHGDGGEGGAHGVHAAGQFARELPGVRKVMDELMAMRVRVTPEGNAQYGAWREGAHDDLALAVALACWRATGDSRVVGEMSCGRLV
jgi:hypothetical protein